MNFALGHSNAQEDRLGAAFDAIREIALVEDGFDLRVGASMDMGMFGFAVMVVIRMGVVMGGLFVRRVMPMSLVGVFMYVKFPTRDSLTISAMEVRMGALWQVKGRKGLKENRLIDPKVPERANRHIPCNARKTIKVKNSHGNF
jgi:hypothetical protein